MKEKKRLLILIGVLAVVLVLAAAGYRYLSQQYEPEQPQVTVQEETTEEEPAEELVMAPDFTVFTEDGEEVRLSDYAGKPVVINFWATWCGPCKSELPAFDRMYAAYGEEIQFLMVNLTDGQRETVEGVGTFLEENGYTFPVFYDTDYSGAMAYGASSIPLTVFVLADGTLAGGYRGAITEEVLEQSIQIVLEASEK